MAEKVIPLIFAPSFCSFTIRHLISAHGVIKSDILYGLIKIQSSHVTHQKWDFPRGVGEVGVLKRVRARHTCPPLGTRLSRVGRGLMKKMSKQESRPALPGPD